MWPFSPADYPGKDYSSGYEAAALELTPPAGTIKWTANAKNQEVTFDARTSEGKPIERYFITDPWGDRFIMYASGETDPADVRSNFLSAVLPPGWTKSIGHLKRIDDLASREHGWRDQLQHIPRQRRRFFPADLMGQAGLGHRPDDRRHADLGRNARRHHPDEPNV